MVARGVKIFDTTILLVELQVAWEGLIYNI